MRSRTARKNPRKRTGLKAIALADEDDQLANLADLDSDQRAQTLLSEIGRLKRRLTAVATHESIIVETVRQAIVGLPTIKIPAPSIRRSGTEEVPVLHLSDLHIGKITATYDSGVAELRVRKALAATLEILAIRRSNAVINEARVYLGGDIVDGETVYPRQAHQIDQNVFEQSCNSGATIVAGAIMTLLTAVKRIKIVAVPGNHGRPDDKKCGRYHPKTNWDSVLYENVRHIVEKHCIRNNRERDVNWDLPSARLEDWYATDEVLGWGNMLIHGQEIKGGYAGYPWYGVGKKAHGWIDAIPEQWKYLWLGHFHTYMRLDHNKRIILANGTTVSDDRFAKQEMATCGEPKQRLAIFNRRLGLVTDNPLYLADDVAIGTQGAKRRSA